MKKVAIIVGHEADKPGMIPAQPIGGTEYEFNNAIAIDIYRFCRDLGMDCQIFLRDGIGRSGVIEKVNEWEADCSIELHLNAYDTKTKGTETLHINSLAFAQIIQKKMCQVFERTVKQDRGVKILMLGERGAGNMLGLKCPAVLVECVFADNKEEAQLLSSKALLYSKCVAESAFEFLKGAV